jgi:hypothetical protein
LELLGRTLAHLPRGPLGEGHRRDAFDRRTAATHGGQHALDQKTGLARSRTGEHDQVGVEARRRSTTIGKVRQADNFPVRHRSLPVRE